MGKTQKKKAMRRHNPVRVPDSHLPKGLSAAASSSTKNEAILPIIQKMESPESADRKWACVAVSNLIQNDPSTRRLLQGKNVVGALIARLTDSEEEVILEAMGSLRNLCIDGGYDICGEMYNKNILTPLKVFVSKISETLSDPSKVPKNSPIHLFADNVITTLWCLSETSNKALNAINAMNLVPFLMSFLMAREHLPLTPVTAAAQCLYVLTDDNEPAIFEVRSDANYVASLLAIDSFDDSKIHNDVVNDMSAHRLLTLRVLSAGILRNISPLPPTQSPPLDVDKTVVIPLLAPVISSISLTDISDNTQMLLSQQAEEQTTQRSSTKNSPKSDHKSPSELALELLEVKLRTVQLSLEVLTGTCATLPEPELPAANEDDSEITDDVTEDTEMPVDVESRAPSPFRETAALVPTLVPTLLALVYPTSLSFPPLAATSPYPPITSALSAVHISALECLTNIFLGMSTYGNVAIAKDIDSGAKVWDSIWAALTAVGTEVSGLGQERRQDMWSTAVGVLWGVGNVWKGSLAPSEEQVKLLIQFYEASTDRHVRVQCVGTLECLAQYPSVDSNRVISDYLIKLLPGSEPVVDVEPVLQATSALIDIYSDENLPYDVNFRQGHYLQKLAGSVDELKRAVKAIDKRKQGGRELRRRGDEVLENLVAFIQYRRELGL